MDHSQAPRLIYTVRACECFPKITQERDSNKSNKEMRFPDFSLEMLIAKIINIWLLGISVSSFILKDLKVLCRLGQTERSCLCWWNAAISRSGWSRHLMLEMYILVLKKGLPSGFGPAWGTEGWKNTCRSKQCGVPPLHLATSTRNPPLLSLPAAQGSSLLSVPSQNLTRSSRNQTSSEFPPRKLKLSSFHPFLCILKLSHSSSCFPWYRLYTEPGEHCSFPPLCLFLAWSIFSVFYFMLAYAGKCLGELTGKVLQNAVCIVFLSPVWVPSSAAPKVGLMHQGESGLDSFYMESGCQGEKIKWRRGLFTYFQLLNFIQQREEGHFPCRFYLICFLSSRCQIYAGSIYELHLCWCENLWGPSVEMLVFHFLPSGLRCPMVRDHTQSGWTLTLGSQGHSWWAETSSGQDVPPSPLCPPSHCLLRLCLHA